MPGLYNHDNDASSALQLGDYGDGWAGEDFSFVFKAPDKDSRQLGTRCMDAWLVSGPLDSKKDGDAYLWPTTATFANPHRRSAKHVEMGHALARVQP